MKRQRRKIGNVLEIKVKDDLYSYGIEINDKGYVAFFDYFIDSPDKYKLDDLLNSPLIYKFCISRFLVTKSYFKIVENVNVEDYNIDTTLKPRYIHDALTGKYRIYNWPDKDIPTTKEYIIEHKLQCLAVFDGAEQIQDLLLCLHEKRACQQIFEEPWIDPYSDFNLKG
ncbi:MULTISPECIES: Imm26 family immunity protein [Cysteiniphilum]|uniref:Uncharacterized protein n=1 Tax=Cysteiniphilum litorale TaxID=2056700 RepID=A0A8J2Z4A0_9GAMM|nr:MULTISPECIES: Imm26 family immunity protein [Cysteiniphilum]GGF98047.1 hypothetical protein GCM10010995_14080 [Cysteiniphilum litorale]